MTCWRRLTEWTEPAPGAAPTWCWATAATTATSTATPVIARRGTEHGSGLGTQRWVGDA